MAKYKTAQGEYLQVDETNRGYRIAWYIPSIEDIGTYVGEHFHENSPKPTDKEALEVWTANTIGAQFKEEQDAYGFVFDKRAASKALAAINTALLNMNCPWPDWAVKAKSEGWAPPPNWNP